MQWRGRRQSSNVEDMRGASGGGMFGGGGIPGGGLGGGFGGGGVRRAGGGLGIGGIIVLLIVCWLFGINPMTLLSDSGGPVSGQSYPQTTDQAGLPGSQAAQGTTDEMRDFVGTVLADTEDTWSGIFKGLGATYRNPTLVLFSGGIQSACGTASASSGPFYCPNDQKLYIDLDFYAELRDRFHAPGDFAQAYVIAHEVGHHVQNLIGILPEYHRQIRGMSEAEANQMSVRIELQADCLAGVWANHSQQEGLLDAGDMDEALNAAAQIGDDRIQKRTQGYVVPESFNHGSSQQRQTWLKRGFQSGNMDSCDTLKGQI